MIICITPNPAIDRTLLLPSLVVGAVQRAQEVATSAGRRFAQGSRVRVVSTAGSGDSFLGGLVNALDRGSDWPAALCDAVAAGTANALSAGGGQFTLQEFNGIRGQIQVQAW
ncbi:MAG TPA: PfkB family carbohydrate kinase [Anaerolineales bacterium]|nr:PfkB family carbohydrate kinase [Anaerolineales bacterium]